MTKYALYSPIEVGAQITLKLVEVLNQLEILWWKKSHLKVIQDGDHDTSYYHLVGEWLHEEVEAKYRVRNFSVELYLEPYPNANLDATLNGKFPSIASSYSSMLSQPFTARRVNLAQSTILSIPFYAMQFTRLPESIYDDVDKKVRKRRRLALRFTRQAYSAFLAKLSWRLTRKPESLWSHLLRSKYCNNRCNLDIFITKSNVSVVEMKKCLGLNDNRWVPPDYVTFIEERCNEMQKTFSHPLDLGNGASNLEVKEEVFLKWQPPPDGWVLLNVDGASKGNLALLHDDIGGPMWPLLIVRR
ncbi:hypothetical protein Cgig2_009007 [Carnegiea gigantea]|uniref:Uncharacterized protein n=1 Tax=Carnegiea gigantea TaxID=171969 RepID=A0A9Q1KCT1_9CARY|nr:hypothetical protein Cgig2_009007 [Carnegiea gigantea]